MILALTTLPSREAAEKLIRTLLDAQLIACGSCLPGALSIYSWQGKVCSEEETLVFLKAPKGKRSALESKLLEIHPYEVPEFLAFEADHVSDAYLHWAMTVCLGDQQTSH